MSDRGCDEVRALLAAHLDGDLEPAAAARVREHLEGCPACRERRETLRLAVEALRRLPELPPPASILAGVRARLRPVPWHRRLFARRPWLVGVPVGALATALVALGVALFQARYPQLPQVAERRTAAPPAVTRGTRTDGPQPRQVPQAPPEAGRDAAAGPAPAARKAPAPPAVPVRRPAAPAERAVTVARPEPPAAAPATPTASPVPSPPPAPARQEAPPSRSADTGAAIPPGTRFAVPRPAPAPTQVPGEPRREAAPAPRQLAIPEPPPAPRQLAGEPRRETAPEKPGVAPFLETARRSIAGAPAGVGTAPGLPAIEAPAVSRSLETPGATALRRTPAPTTSGTGLLKATAPRRTPEPQPQPSTPAPESVEALTVLLAAGEDFNEMRQLVLRVGGRILDTRVLDPRARREAFLPHRSRPGVRGDVSQGWKLTVRMPRRAIPGFAEELERRPGRLVLDRRTRPAAVPARTAGEQTLRITVLR